MVQKNALPVRLNGKETYLSIYLYESTITITTIIIIIMCVCAFWEIKQYDVAVPYLSLSYLPICIYGARLSLPHPLPLPLLPTFEYCRSGSLVKHAHTNTLAKSSVCVCVCGFVCVCAS